MRICLASIHPRRLSGQIESLVALARELEKLGHATAVVSAFDDDLLFRRNEASPERYGDPGSLASKLARLLKTVGRVTKAGRQADLIHLNLPTPALSWVADLVQRWARQPLIVGYEAHLADAWQLIRGPYLWRDLRFYLPRVLINNGLWGRLSLYRCQRYVVASFWQRQELRALGVAERRIVSIPNLVDRAKLGAGERGSGRAGDASTPALPLSRSHAPTIGWIGHFHHVKGVDILLDAFARLVQRRPDARLALAWSGLGDEGAVQAQIQALGLDQSVLRLGRLDVADFFSAVAVLALPYRLTIGQNAFPNLVLEAMEVGVPLVTSDLPLLRELVTHGETALLAQPGDPSSLANALGRLLDEPDLARGLVAAQRRLMAGELDAGVLAGRYAALYEEVLAEHAGVLRPA